MTYTLKSPSKFRSEIKAKLSELADDAVSQHDCTLGEGRKVVVKVSAKGKRRRKVVCGPGKKFDGTKCVIQKASEKLAKKKGMRKKVRTQKAAGAGKRKKATKLRLKALKKRKGMGL